jgi:hypothetical protein
LTWRGVGPNIPLRIASGEEESVGKGAKIAIGCFVVLLAGAVVLTVGLGFGAYWLKGKAEQVTGNIAKTAEDLSRYEKAANSNPFTRPPDGAFAEDRLLKFLEVRKSVYAIYQEHRADFENAKKKKEADLGDIMKFGGLVADIKLAQEKAQAEVGMSDEEYVFMVQSVYGAAMNSNMQKETGKTTSETFDAALDQSKKMMEEAARRGGTAGSPEMADAERQIDEAQRQLSTGFGAPQSNIDLYRKHEADIKKYTMEGLAFIGL